VVVKALMVGLTVGKNQSFYQVDPVAIKALVAAVRLAVVNG
jgi:hypothetical protein